MSRGRTSRRLLGDEKGLTLFELIVVMFIIGLVFWLGWHVIQMRRETVEPYHVLANIGLDMKHRRLALAQSRERAHRAKGDVAHTMYVDDRVILADLVDSALEFPDHAVASLA